MTFPKGTYLGGVRTLEDLRGRCRIDDETGCWMWAGGASGKQPRVWCFDPTAGKFKSIPAARAAWILGGDSPVAGRVVYHARCTNWLCVNPAHLAVGTKAEEGAHLRKHGTLRGDPARSAANAASVRRHRSKLTPELVREIRASTEKGVSIASRLGIAHGIVSNVRLGKIWRDGAPGASVFSWRP